MERNMWDNNTVTGPYTNGPAPRGHHPHWHLITPTTVTTWLMKLIKRESSDF